MGTITWVGEASSSLSLAAVLAFAAGCSVSSSTEDEAVDESAGMLQPEPMAALLLFHPFDGTAEDDSGNDRHGRPVGAVATAGHYGAMASAYRLDPAAHVALDAAAFEGLRDFSFSAWLELSDLNEGSDAFNAILSVASDSQDNELLFGFASNDTRERHVNQLFVSRTFPIC